MKKIFILLLAILIAASIYTYLTGASKRTDVPVISWKSDANPQRYEQIDMYHKFLQKNGVVKEDGSPRGQLVLDTASNQSTLIQAVSGMAGDIFDADQCDIMFDFCRTGRRDCTVSTLIDRDIDDDRPRFHRFDHLFGDEQGGDFAGDER